jgi:hypothetical protein
MSRNNSIDISVSRTRTRTISWEHRRSNSLGSIESIDIEINKTTNKTTNKMKSDSVKIIINEKDKKKRARDVYIDINDPYKNPTPTPSSFLEQFMKSDLLWTKYK